MNKTKRVVDFGPLHMRMPIGAWVSILHRVTGVLLVAALPLLLYMMQQSLGDVAGFARMESWLASRGARIVLIAGVAVFALHFFAGVRHLLLDLDLGVARQPARRSAAWVLVAAGVTAIVMAGWLL